MTYFGERYSNVHFQHTKLKFIVLFLSCAIRHLKSKHDLYHTKQVSLNDHLNLRGHEHIKASSCLVKSRFFVRPIKNEQGEEPNT